MRYATICTLALALCASVAAAQQPTPPSGDAPWYVRAAPATPVADPLLMTDRNADGELNWEEFRNLIAKLFYVADRDGDEVLAGDEVKLVLKQEELGKADQNKDGMVQYREFVAYSARVFLLTDVDHSGSLTPNEIHKGAAKGESR